MKVRLILKTHYQINKPGIFSVILKKCTSPYKINYPDVVSKKLLSVPFKRININKESSKFAVSMAQSLGLITKNMLWDWKGHAISIILDENPRNEIDGFLDLKIPEKLIYLKYYLEADGAAIISVCKILKKINMVSRDELLTSALIDDIFLGIWESYRRLTSNLMEKTKLRQQIERLKSKPYTYKTRIHKALSHVEPLIDFGFIKRIEGKKGVIFKVNVNDGFSPIDRLIVELDSIEALEERFSKFEYFKVLSEIYGIKLSNFNPGYHSYILRREIFNAYMKARTEPTMMASINIISDVVSTKMLSQNQFLVEKPQIENELRSMKLENPRGVNFHVDKTGRNAYVILSDNICN